MEINSNSKATLRDTYRQLEFVFRKQVTWIVFVEFKFVVTSEILHVYLTFFAEIAISLSSFFQQVSEYYIYNQ